MKQNSQWLSHVRTRSNRAECTSTGGSPARNHGDLALEAASAQLDDHVRVDQGPPLEQVGHLAVDGQHLVADRQPSAAGDRATATTRGRT